jgi:hypothetical protein
MVKQPSKTEPASKAPPAYPYYGYNASLGMASAVATLGGDRNEVAKKILAGHMQKAESSPSFTQLIASAKVFGMIEGWGSYKLTEHGKRYFLPSNDTDRAHAALSFFRSPLAFRRLIERFDGNPLPDVKTLENILRRDEESGVPKSWAERTAGIFRTAADQLGLIDAGGHLRYGAAKLSGRQVQDRRAEAAPQTNEPSSVAPESSGIRDAVSVEVMRPSPGMNTWIFTEGGGTLKLETPDPLPKALWQRLQKYVEAIEPVKSGKEK